MYNSNMNECRKYKSDKIINKILKNHFQEFREKKWHRVRKEMREHIINIVERTLNCGNIEKGYIKHKCIECNEEYIHGFTQHIHPKGFRVVRRYGLYSRVKNKLSIEIVKLYNFIKQRNIYEIIKNKISKE